MRKSLEPTFLVSALELNPFYAIQGRLIVVVTLLDKNGQLRYIELLQRGHIVKILSIIYLLRTQCVGWFVGHGLYSINI